MKNTEQFIKDATEGGWKTLLPPIVHMQRAEMFLDPDAWRAVGKARGWDDLEKMHSLGGSPHQEDCWCKEKNWLTRMHGLIGALAEGKSIEDYLGTI